MKFKNEQLLIALLFAVSIILIGCVTPETEVLKVLHLAKLAHGGENLDNLRTVRKKGFFDDSNEGKFELTVVEDFENSKIRVELRQQGNLVSVKQIEGKVGWLWTKDKQTSLSDEQIKEVKQFHGTHLRILKNDILKSNKIIDPKLSHKENNGLKYVSFSVEDIQYNLLIDKQNLIKRASWSENNIIKSHSFEYLELVDGILFPIGEDIAKRCKEPDCEIFHTRILTTVIEVNPSLSERDLQVPN